MSQTPMIGFMQGRLSPLIDGKIQCFPWPYWKDEFELAQRHGFPLMEWTLDQEDLYRNPLMTEAGRREIRHLQKKHGVQILSLTGDCFMQAPFYKRPASEAEGLICDLRAIIAACGDLGIRFLLIPLVDDGRIENPGQETALKKGLETVIPDLKKNGMLISFESDFPPQRLRDFIAGFDPDCFGLTYDIGNSAALGYDPSEEIEACHDRIVNVHVKDRVLNGATVPLETGNADLPGVFRLLKQFGYSGNYILQTARAENGNHAEVLCDYRDRVHRWLNGA